MESILYTTQTVEFDWYSNRVRRNSSLKVFLTWSGGCIAIGVTVRLTAHQHYIAFYLTTTRANYSTGLSSFLFACLTVSGRNLQSLVATPNSTLGTTTIRPPCKKKQESRLSRVYFSFFLSFGCFFFYLFTMPKWADRERDRGHIGRKKSKHQLLYTTGHHQGLNFQFSRI